MNFIIEPATGKKFNLFSKEGTKLLKKFIKVYQSGGSNLV